MRSAKDIVLAPISRSESDACVRAWHYSGRPYNKSILHVGAFVDGTLCGCLAWGPGIDTRKLIGLIPGTQWDGYLELNRMAFSDALPRNSESRAIAICVRALRSGAPWLRWLVSFADGAQSGSGTIYRAAGWVLTSERENATLWRDEYGRVVSSVGMRTSARLRAAYGARSARDAGLERLRGTMRRYMVGLDAVSSAAIEDMRIDTRGRPVEGSETRQSPRAFDSTRPLYIPTQTGSRPALSEAIAAMPRYTDPMGATSRAARSARHEARAAARML